MLAVRFTLCIPPGTLLSPVLSFVAIGFTKCLLSAIVAYLLQCFIEHHQNSGAIRLRQDSFSGVCQSLITA